MACSGNLRARDHFRERKKSRPISNGGKKKKCTRKEKKKRPRKRITAQKVKKDRPQRAEKEEPSDKEIQEKIKQTLAKLSGKGKKGGGAKYRREKRSAIAEAEEEKALREIEWPTGS